MKKLFIYDNFTIRRAYKRMNSIKRKSLIVVDKNLIILGVISDGDIRRSIIDNVSIDKSIKNIYNKKPFIFNENKYNLEDCKKVFAEQHFDLIPVINDRKKIVKIIYWENLLKKPKIKLNKVSYKKNIEVVIMAGGRAKRMGKISKVIPKPLMPYNNQISLVEKIIENYNLYGIYKFNLILNYKSSLIQNFFNKKKIDYKVNFYTEKKFLGTVGGLTLLKNKLKKSFFLTNCDSIINFDFNKLYKEHLDKKNQFTIISCSKKLIYPYGVCNIDKNNNLIDIKEKPNFNFLVNTGCYIINPKILRFLPVNTFMDMNEFIKILIENKINISVIKIDNNSWLDLGSIDKIKENFDK